MFFTSAHPHLVSALRHPAYANAGYAAERFLNQALRGQSTQACTSTEDDTAYTLTMDMPGIHKEQLSISIEGAIVRIQSKEDAPRKYRAAYEFAQEIDSSLSEAKLENGVLSLKLAKLAIVSKATELTIH